MMFTQQLAVAIVKGEKTQTRRRVSSNPRSPWREPGGMAHDRVWTYPVGKVFTVNPGRGVPRVAECKVTGRYLQPIGEGFKHYAEEGFSSLLAYIDAWTKINRRAIRANGGNIDLSEKVHVVEFKLVGPPCPTCGGSGREQWSPIPTMHTTRDCSACFGTMIEVTPAARVLIAEVAAEGG